MVNIIFLYLWSLQLVILLTLTPHTPPTLCKCFSHYHANVKIEPEKVIMHDLAVRAPRLRNEQPVEIRAAGTVSFLIFVKNLHAQMCFEVIFYLLIFDPVLPYV